MICVSDLDEFRFCAECNKLNHQNLTIQYACEKDDTTIQKYFEHSEEQYIITFWHYWDVTQCASEENLLDCHY